MSVEDFSTNCLCIKTNKPSTPIHIYSSAVKMHKLYADLNFLVREGHNFFQSHEKNHC